MSLFLLQLRGELRKLFARKRTYIGFGGVSRGRGGSAGALPIARV
jgi:hypothetical protein